MPGGRGVCIRGRRLLRRALRCWVVFVVGGAGVEGELVSWNGRREWERMEEWENGKEYPTIFETSMIVSKTKCTV